MKQYDIPYNSRTRYHKLLYDLKHQAGWRCSNCLWKVRPFERIEIIVHHKNNNPLDNNLWNLEVLCRDCHDDVHGRNIPKLQKSVRTPVSQKKQYDENGWPI